MNKNHTTTERVRRNDEFLRIFKSALHEMIASGVKKPHDAAVRYTLEHGKPSYHVSHAHAYRVVSALLAGRPLRKVNPLLCAMWHEIAAHAAAVIDERRCSISRAVDVVLLEQRASRFFITEGYALRLAYSLRRASREELARHTMHA